jgi:LPS-assembly lipoprotein
MWWPEDLHRRRALLRAATAGASAWLLSGCDFRLRTLPDLPFSSIALSGFASRSPLALDFERALQSRVSLQRSPERADVVLHALRDARERSVVAQTSAAQVRELQLRLRFDFRAHTPAGRALVPPAQILLTREMSFNESNALAKEAEEAEHFREMQADVVLQVMRRLAAIRL